MHGRSRAHDCIVSILSSSATEGPASSLLVDSTKLTRERGSGAAAGTSWVAIAARITSATPAPRSAEMLYGDELIELSENIILGQAGGLADLPPHSRLKRARGVNRSAANQLATHQAHKVRAGANVHNEEDGRRNVGNAQRGRKVHKHARARPRG